MHGAELLARVAAQYPGPRLSPLLPVDVSDRATSPLSHGIVAQAAARVKQQSNPPPSVTAQALRAAFSASQDGACEDSSEIHRVDVSSETRSGAYALGMPLPWTFPGAGPLERL